MSGVLRVAIATLGCKVNQYDSACIETKLCAAGCEVVPFEPGADVYVVNTCTVTDRADAEGRQVARRARRFNPRGRVIMTGCFAQVNPAGATIPEVDHVVGLNRLPDLVRAVRGELERGGPRALVDDLRTARQVRTLGAEAFAGQTRAFLKIQEGCDLFCSFCVVPFARGRSRSVAPREVLRQIKRLAKRGFQEVVLTGVHLGGYGDDLEPRLVLCDLLEMLLEQADVPRLRLSSIDPPEVSDRLLGLLERSDSLCPHLHIPIQAGHDIVLRRMRRLYDTALVRSVLDEVHRRLPLAAVGTDIIAGFPGETDDQFAAAAEFFGGLPLSYLHVFPYSRRSGTTAAKFAEPVARLVVRARAKQLRELGACKRARFAQHLVGETVCVLVERTPATGLGLCAGYSRNYQRTEFWGPATLHNREARVRVTGVRGAVVTGALAEQNAGGAG
jgi:threonylcarbamoyladenosine tRNA methylthiotransferase MtaB